jgi:hypothetical protein
LYKLSTVIKIFTASVSLTTSSILPFTGSKPWGMK